MSIVVRGRKNHQGCCLVEGPDAGEATLERLDSEEAKAAVVSDAASEAEVEAAAATKQQWKRATQLKQ